MQRLIRILLALVVAVVFAGETASAGRPCRQMAEAPAVASEPAKTPCHETAASKSDRTRATPVTNDAVKSPCECVALLKGSFAEPSALASALIEPWRWAKPTPVAFASLDFAPDGPPPKA